MGRPKKLALIPRDPEAEIEAIRADVVRLEIEDQKIVSATNRAADEDDLLVLQQMIHSDPERLARLGWTPKEVRIAMAANLPKSEAPFFMVAAHERTLARVRRHQEEAGGARINVGNATFNILQPAPRKKDIDVVVVEKEGKR